MSEALAKVVKAVEELKKHQRAVDLAARKTVIEAEVAKVSSKSVKRTLGHLLGSLDYIKDIGGFLAHCPCFH